MRLRSKLCFAAAALFLVAFGFFVSDSGQRFLIGTPAADHWQRDDQYMGAAFAPYAYCLAPSLLFMWLGTAFYRRDRKQK